MGHGEPLVGDDGVRWLLGACDTSKHTSDSRLRGIDEMLDAELPKGTNVARVNLFLNERGYNVENPGRGQTVVAVVRKNRYGNTAAG